MSRTYWRKLGNDWEFLGAYPDGHKVTEMSQASASVLDFEGLSVQDTLDSMDKRYKLVSLPSSITKHMESKSAVSVPFEQIQGFLV